MIERVEVWLSLALLAVPALFAGLVIAQRVPARARALTIAGASVTAVLAGASLAVVLVANQMHLLHRTGDGELFALDGENVVGVCLLALVSLGGAVGGARASFDRVGGAAFLATEGALLGLVTASHIVVFVALWVLSLAPFEWAIARVADADERAREARAWRLLLVGSSASLVTAVVLYAGVSGTHSLAITDALRHPVARRWQDVIFVLLALSAMVRMGAFPLHGWVPVLLARGPIGLLVALGNIQAGVHLLTRVAMPAMPDAVGEMAPFFAAVGLLGSLAGSTLAVVQNDLRRAVGMVMVSQTGMVLQGLAMRNAQGVAGALFEAAAMGLSATGLTLIIGAVESRAGTTDVTKLGGVAQRAPRMAGLFVAFAYATVGFPGSPTFVGEDLLLHGIIEHHPVVASVMLVATVLNGVALFRLIGRGFLGPDPDRARSPRVAEDLLPREFVAVVAIFALTLGGGLLPGPLLALRHSAVDAITLAHR